MKIVKGVLNLIHNLWHNVCVGENSKVAFILSIMSGCIKWCNSENCLQLTLFYIKVDRICFYTV